MVIWNQPSPTTTQTSESGFANFAPISGGKESGKNPSYRVTPEVISVEARCRWNTDANIWCWTDVGDAAMMAAPRVSFKGFVDDMGCVEGAPTIGKA